MCLMAQPPAPAGAADRAGAAAPPRTRLRYLPLAEVRSGMVLGAPLLVVERNTLRFRLPGGHVLTPGNLDQLAVFQAESVCIAEPDVRDAGAVAAEAAAAAARVLAVFAHADLTQPVTAALFDRVLAYRSA
jgi:hypothetical protein